MLTAMTVVRLCIGAAFAFALPIGALLRWRGTHPGRLTPFFVGMLTFVVFALGLEQLLHWLCLVLDSPVSRAIRGSTVLYVLYGCLAAGVFEETGRWFAFRFPLKKHPGRVTAVTYGLGHGGAECMLLLGVNYAVYAVLAVLALKGDLRAALALDGMGGAESLLGRLTAGAILLALLERAAALLLQVALSIYVFLAVRGRRKGRYFRWAILLHALADAPAALYQRGVLSLAVAELLLWIVSLSVLLWARRLWLEQTDP